MDFDSFMGQAWDDHAADPQGVAARLGDAGLALLAQADPDAQATQLPALATLAHHVYGEHLGQWHEGQALLQMLAALPAAAAPGAAADALRRCQASLALCAGDADARSGLSAADAIRVGAMAAAGLGPHDAARASLLLQDAVDATAQTALPAADPALRALAVNGNNLASTLEEKTSRSDEERALMILAAQTARTYWALAGGWLETERAEYRLAMTWLAAGDPARARQHADACLAIVSANDGAALERFFGWEALALVHRASDDAEGHAQAIAEMDQAFTALDEADRGWCQASLDKARA